MTGDMFGGQPVRTAKISDCGCYRYRLDRGWDARLPRVCFVMLNPSTADGTDDDATLRKITAYAKAWGYGSLVVVNLFAWRSREPKALRQRGIDPVGGPVADLHLRAALTESDAVVCGWGGSVPPSSEARISDVLAMIIRAGHEPMALAVTKSGAPGHPLYLPGALTPTSLAALRATT